MPTFRLVWEYVENTGSTFNEIYYVDSSTAASAVLTTNSLALNRLAFLHPLNRLVQIRSSQVDANRVTGLSIYNWYGTATSTPVVGPATPGDAIVCTLAGATSGSRRIWLRGAPDDFIIRSPNSGIDLPPPKLQDALTAWFKSLQQNGYGLRLLATQVPGPLTNLKILSVDGTAKDGTSLVTLAAAPGYPFPSRVIIGSASKKDLPALNGRWSLLAAPAGAVIRIPYQTPGGLVFTGGNAKCRQETYQTTIIFSATNCGFHHYGTRTTKNPITHSRGARRAVRIRTSL